MVLLYRWIDDRRYWLRVVEISPPASPSSSSVYVLRPTTKLRFQIRQSTSSCNMIIDGNNWLHRIRSEFADGGIDLAAILQKVSNTLRKNENLSASSSSVYLFHGVAGSGKTKLAKSIAVTSGVHFTDISCSEIFKSSTI